MNGKIITHSVLPVQVCLPAQSAVALTGMKNLSFSVDNVIGKEF